jgi:hypothetical protein
MAATRYSTKEKAAIEIYGRRNATVAAVRNLSVSGACLEWDEQEFRLTKGDLIRMTVVLKAVNRKHNVSAEVIWVTGKKMGVNFIAQDQILEKLTEKS